MALVFWGTALLVHCAAALAVWWLLPGGFPFVHERFFAHRLLPALIVCSAPVVALAAQRRAPQLPLLLLAFPAAWVGMALALLFAFPNSGPGLALAAATIAVCLFLGLALVAHVAALARMRFVTALCSLGAACCGAGFVLTQRSPAPSTHPHSDASAVPDARVGPALDVDLPLQLAPWLHVVPSLDEIRVAAGALQVVVSPRLEFVSVSPDRFWTVFAPRRREPRRELAVFRHAELGLQIDDSQGERWRVFSPSTGGAVVAVQSTLAQPVYSHLNSFAELRISGHERLGLRFSPCPQLLVEVGYSDYPVGAPAEFAYLDADEIFHVVRASSAEKGPFTRLGSGSLKRGQALEITLLELGAQSERELARFAFADWSRQASTELSPTAGWGVPQNAVEFGLASTDPRSDAYIDLTLAGTSVGRGWDSVGHASGIYINRIEIRLPSSVF
jgi:hypothetical protein